jgi:hypothetical protein
MLASSYPFRIRAAQRFARATANSSARDACIQFVVVHVSVTVGVDQVGHLPSGNGLGLMPKLASRPFKESYAST